MEITPLVTVLSFEEKKINCYNSMVMAKQLNGGHNLHKVIANSLVQREGHLAPHSYSITCDLQVLWRQEKLKSLCCV